MFGCLVNSRHPCASLLKAIKPLVDAKMSSRKCANLQASDLAANELRAAVAAEKQAAAAAGAPGRKRDAGERACDALALAGHERDAARGAKLALRPGSAGARRETLACLTLGERKRELVVRAAVRRQAAQRAAEAASWARHMALEEQVREHTLHMPRMLSACVARLRGWESPPYKVGCRSPVLEKKSVADTALDA